MAPELHIIITGSTRHVHLSLVGELDGEGAVRLAETLRSCARQAERVTVNTNCLSTIHPEGSETVRRVLDGLGIRRYRVLFTGNGAECLAPGESVFFH